MHAISNVHVKKPNLYVNFNPSMGTGVMKLDTHSQTPTIAPLKFWTG